MRDDAHRLTPRIPGAGLFLEDAGDAAPAVTAHRLAIAHIEVYTKDVTSPTLQIVGMPASRPLFEKLRDSIEIQRQSRRVMGLME